MERGKLTKQWSPQFTKWQKKRGGGLLPPPIHHWMGIILLGSNSNMKEIIEVTQALTFDVIIRTWVVRWWQRYSMYFFCLLIFIILCGSLMCYTCKCWYFNPLFVLFWFYQLAQPKCFYYYLSKISEHCTAKIRIH